MISICSCAAFTDGICDDIYSDVHIVYCAWASPRAHCNIIVCMIVFSWYIIEMYIEKFLLVIIVNLSFFYSFIHA